MPTVNRRHFLGVLAAATVAGVGVARETVGVPPRTFPARSAAAASLGTSGLASPALLAPPPPGNRIPLPGGGALTRLPGTGDLLALTVDDGVNSEVVRLYTQFAKDTGIRLTFFVNGRYGSWTEHLGDAAPAGRIRADPTRQPHLVPPGSDDRAATADSRRTDPQRPIPENNVRNRRRALLPATVRQAQRDR